MQDRNTPRRVPAEGTSGTATRPPTRLVVAAIAALLLAALLGVLLLDQSPRTDPESRTTRSAATETAARTSFTPSPAPKREGSPAAQSPAGAPSTSLPRPQRARHDPLPLASSGRVDFAALGMTGKEEGAELLRSEEPEQPAPVRYAFEVGETWDVVTYYREMQAGDGDVWSAPVRWRYHVEREGAFRGAPVRVIVVRMLDARGRVDGRFPATTFYVGKDDQRLAGADLYEVRAGKGKYTTVAFGQTKGPQHARGSIVPFDLPPNGLTGSKRLGSALRHLEPATAASRARFPQAGELVGAGAEQIALSYALPEGGTVRQRWAPGDMRWPVESIGPHRRSYRLE